MNTLNAIIFPDITAEAKTVIPLLHFFSSFVHCRPVENDESQELATQFLDSDFCKIHIPAPLGEDRERFLQLISDLQNRKEDYANQLSQLSLAGIGHSRKTTSESRSSILSSLLKSKGIENSTENKKEESRTLILWQARLVLKLGEMFDLEQAGLDRDLAQLKQVQEEVFSELQGEADLSFLLTKQLSQVHGSTDGQLKLRLKSWSRLLFLGEPCKEKNSVYITSHRDAFDRLADEYDKLQATLPARLISISLPLIDPEKISEIPAAGFAKEAAESLQCLRDSFQNPDGVEDAAGSDLLEVEQQWCNLVEKYYPETEQQRCQLSIYSFSGVAAKQLFLNSFGSDDDLLFEEQAHQKENLLIGFLEQPL